MDAHQRRRFGQALLEGKVQYAAGAGVQTKEGHRLWSKVARDLEKLAAI